MKKNKLIVLMALVTGCSSSNGISTNVNNNSSKNNSSIIDSSNQEQEEEIISDNTEDYQISINESGIIVQADFLSAIVEIPSVIGGIPVTEIAGEAFAGNKIIEEVIIPESVESIGLGAFKDCENLNTISLPFIGGNMVEEDKQHFGYIFGATSYLENKDFVPENLESVVIQEKIISRGIKRLSSTLNSSEFTRIFNYAFYQTNISYINIPSTVTSIGEYAFFNSGLKQITLPESVISIEDHAFDQNRNLLEVVVLSETPFPLGTDVFTDNTIIKVPAGKVADYSSNSYWNEYANLIIPEDFAGYIIKDVAGGAEIVSYQGNDSIVTIPSIIAGKTIVGIGREAFYNRSAHTIILPDTITYISDYGFYYSKELVNITLSNNLLTIGGLAFFSTKIETLNLPASLQNITYSSFFNSTLKNINVDSNNPNFASVDGVLYNKSITTLIRFPSKSPIVNYSTPSTIERINDYAFYISSLDSVEIGNQVETIEYTAFAFSDVKAFIVDSGNDSFIAVDDALYSQNDGNLIELYRIAIDARLEFEIKSQNINSYALWNAKVEKIILGENVDNLVRTSEFHNCRFLKEFDSKNSNYQVIDGILYQDNILLAFPRQKSFYEDYTLPEETLVISANAFTDVALNNLYLNDNLEFVEDDAFVTGYIQSLFIPSNVTNISQLAFRNAYILEFSVADENLEFFSYEGSLYKKDPQTLIKASPIIWNENISFFVKEGTVIIGENAFVGFSTEDKTIYLPESVAIVEDAFGPAYKIVFASLIPPVIDPLVIEKINMALIEVPAEALEAYEMDYPLYIDRFITAS